MTKKEVEKIVHDYIMSNLTVEIEHVWDYYCDNPDTKVTIKLNDELVDWDTN